MDRRKFIIELKAPPRPSDCSVFYKEMEDLITMTGRVSLASKPFGHIASGFDKNYNLASHLLRQNPDLDILFHITCHDINIINIRARLTALRQLGIRRLLVVSGDDYQPSENSRMREFQFRDSHSLATSILQDYNWFESIAVAAYPGGSGFGSFNNEQEFARLSKALQAGVSEVYTQCVFDPNRATELDRLIRSKFPHVKVIPSVALFDSLSDMEKIVSLTRTCGAEFYELTKQLKQLGAQEAREFSFKFLATLCCRLGVDFDLIGLCSFGRYDLAKSLIDRELI